MLPQAVSSCVRQQTEENGHREEGRETEKIRREWEVKLGTKMQGFLPHDEQKDHSAPRSLRYPHQVLRESTFGADVLQHMQILHSSTSVIVTEFLEAASRIAADSIKETPDRAPTPQRISKRTDCQG